MERHLLSNQQCEMKRRLFPYTSFVLRTVIDMKINISTIFLFDPIEMLQTRVSTYIFAYHTLVIFGIPTECVRIIMGQSK